MVLKLSKFNLYFWIAPLANKFLFAELGLPNKFYLLEGSGIFCCPYLTLNINLLTCRKDSFLLLSDEGKEGVLLFHQELVGESMSARVGIGTSGPVDGERSGAIRGYPFF